MRIRTVRGYLLKIARITIPAMALCFLAGCALSVVMVPLQLDSTANGIAARTIILERDAEVRLSTGYRRKLTKGSVWTYVGSTQHGLVYKSVGSVFTVEGANVHEAYLVVSGDELMGFYLPVEDSYTSLSKPVHLYYRAQAITRGATSP